MVAWVCSKSSFLTIISKFTPLCRVLLSATGSTLFIMDALNFDKVRNRWGLVKYIFPFFFGVKNFDGSGKMFNYCRTDAMA